MSKWNPEVYKILKEAGWYEEREIDTTEIVQLLLARGFKVTQPIIDFVKSFGMLDIIVSAGYTPEMIQKYGFDPFRKYSTDIIKTLGDAGDYYCTKIFEVYANEQLTIVGKVSNMHLDLMISESGKFFCDEGKLGDTVEEAWECILTDERQLIPWGKFD